MTSRSPPDDQRKRRSRFLQPISQRFNRMRDALTPTSRSRPNSPHPEPVATPSGEIQSSSHPTYTGPALNNAPPPGGLDTRTVGSPADQGRSLEPPTNLSSEPPCESLPEPLPLTPPEFPAPAASTIIIRPSESTTWGRLSAALHALQGVSDLFPPLKSAINLFAGCIDAVQAVASNRQEYDMLADELRVLAEFLKDHAGELDSETGDNGSIANIARCIEDQVTYIKQHQERGALGHLVDAVNDQEDVLQRYRQLERLFRQLQCDINLRTRSDVKKQLETTLLRGMSPIDDAMYNSSYSTTVKRRPCTAETRKNTQETLQNWAKDSNSAKIYWMNGMAGTGKTTIAYSFCQWLEATRRLGVSFFCSRISSACRSLSRIVPTIAYQLALYSLAYRSMLCVVLKKNPNAGALNVLQQFEMLVHQPMSQVQDAIPDGVVIVIDALDECDDNYSVRLLLDVLFRFASHIPLKFFVASRPEHVIWHGMMSRGSADRSILRLHDIEQSLVEEDIKKYLTEAFSTMVPPPSPEQVEALAKRARNLFIYAATLVRYIHPGDFYVDSSTRLRTMLNIIKAPNAGAGGKYADLDRLYATVLDVAFDEGLEEEERDCMQCVLWIIVRAKEPITGVTLASLASLPKHQAWSGLQPLRSVLHVPEDSESGLISVLHASFPEYMLNPSRSKKYSCNESEVSKMLTHRCLEVMQSQLQFNICQLPNSCLTDEQVPALEVHVAKYISSTLSYACRYWSWHLLSSPASSDTRTMLLDFLSNRLLFWMEVLSLNRCIGIGVPMLQQAQTWISNMKDTRDEIQKQVADARNFVTWFAANPCSKSTPHIYISAFPFCAKSSWVYQNYLNRIQGLANIAIGQRDEATLAIWGTGSELFSMAVSSDGNLIACGTISGTVQVYDMQTGTLLTRPFEGHTGRVRAIAFSPDGTLIASGSDDEAVIIWDSRSGRVISGPFRVHSGIVRSVAFSPDGNCVASSSDDQTVIVWNRLDGTILVGPLRGHSKVYSVAFSPDGRLLASGSDDDSIRLWDACTGAKIREPFLGHENTVYSLAFSPDGKTLVSGSEDCTARVWDVSTGNLITPPFRGHSEPIYAVAFSPDGAHIAAGGHCADASIIAWNVGTGSVVAGPLVGHTSDVYSVVFSHDGTQIISACYDATIRIWSIGTQKTSSNSSNIRETPVGPIAFSPDRSQFISTSSNGTLRVWQLSTGSMPQLFEGQSDIESIDSVAFSPMGTFVAASPGNYSIRIWDAAKGVIIRLSLKGHTSTVRCIAFSPNEVYICSGSDDTTVIMWDIRTGEIVGGPFKGHTGPIQAIAYSPDGTHLASGGADAIIRVWDLATGVLLQALQGHNQPITSVSFSPDGAHIVSGSEDGIIRRWDDGNSNSIILAKCLADFHNRRGSRAHRKPAAVRHLCYSPDGSRILAGFAYIICLYDSQTGEIISELSAPEAESVRWAGYSSDGAEIVSVSTRSEKGSKPSGDESSAPEANIIRVWRAGNDQLSPTLPAATGYWSYERDGRILSPDGFVLWVPPDLLPYLEVKSSSHYNPFILSSDGIVNIEPKDLCVGDRWTECWKGSQE